MSLFLANSCGRAQTPAHPHSSGAETTTTRTAAGILDDAVAYTGHDARGIPHYTRRAFTPEERALLRDVYGVEDPARLYVSDSTEEGLLKYDTQWKRCASCYVNSYRIGFLSVRRGAESWEDAERRVARLGASDFPPSARVENTSTASLDPTIRGDVERMLADAARAGFSLRVVATYRSPLREAYLLRAGGRTHTLTSMHAYGRALDVLVADGNLRHASTRRRWIAFRRWITTYHGGEFRILGTPERTWDWAHVEVPSEAVGFRDIDAALAMARRCSRDPGREPCDFVPNVPH